MTRFTFVFIAGAVSVGIGGFLFALSMTDDIKAVLRSINKSAKSKENLSKKLEQLSMFIQTHATLKQLSIGRFSYQ